MSTGIMAELRGLARLEALELRPTTPPELAPRHLEYRLPIACLQCGGRLAHRTGATTNGRETRALADCTRCGHVHLIAATLSTVPGRPVATGRRSPVVGRTDADIEHGTLDGYYQHRRISPPCDECKAARNAVFRDRRAAARAQKGLLP